MLEFCVFRKPLAKIEKLLNQIPGIEIKSRKTRWRRLGLSGGADIKADQSLLLQDVPQTLCFFLKESGIMSPPLAMAMGYNKVASKKLYRITLAC